MHPVMAEARLGRHYEVNEMILSRLCLPLSITKTINVILIQLQYLTTPNMYMQLGGPDFM